MPKKRPIRVAPTRGQRRQTRQLLGSLQDGLIHERTRKRYFAAVEHFTNFLAWTNLKHATTLDGLDALVSLFITDLWNNGESKGIANDIISGLGHYLPAAKKSVVGARRLLTGWGRLELPVRAPPLTPTFTYAIASYFKEKHWTDSLVLLLLRWETFARPGELFAARKRDFLLSSTRLQGTWVPPLSKSGQRHGAAESLTLSDPWVVVLVAAYLQRLGPDQLLSSCSHELHRQRLWKAVAALQLGADFRWYSVRRGAATAWFLKHNDMGTLTVKGRWSHLKTAKIYIEDAQAALRELSLPDRHLASLLARARALRPTFVP